MDANVINLAIYWNTSETGFHGMARMSSIPPLKMEHDPFKRFYQGTCGCHHIRTVFLHNHDMIRRGTGGVFGLEHVASAHFGACRISTLWRPVFSRLSKPYPTSSPPRQVHRHDTNRLDTARLDTTRHERRQRQDHKDASVPHERKLLSVFQQLSRGLVRIKLPAISRRLLH